MHRNNNTSAPFSHTLSAITAAPGSIASGIILGTNRANQASSNAFAASSDKSLQRDSLLVALNILFAEQQDLAAEEIPGLNLFPALKNALAFSANTIASGVGGLSIGATSGLSHIAQLPLDMTAAIIGILYSVEDSKAFTQPYASTLRVNQELAEHRTGFSAHCQVLSKKLGDVLKNIDKEIHKQIGNESGSAGHSHSVLAGTSAAIPVTATVALAGVLSLGLDSIGSVLRDSTGLSHFLKVESAATENEKNIYHAVNACITVFKDSKDSQQSLLALQNLEKALSNFEQASQMSAAHSVTLPIHSVFIRMITSGSLLGALRTVNSSAIALQVAHAASKQEQDKISLLTQQSASQASSLKGISNGGVNHSLNMTALCTSFEDIIKNIDVNLNNIQEEKARSAMALTAKSTARLGSTITMIPLLITDFAGLISRELSGAIDFTKNDKGTGNESKLVLATRKDQTGLDLDNLMAQVSKLADRLARCQELGVSAPVTLGASHIVTCGVLIGTLNSMMGMCFAFSELRTVCEKKSDLTQLDAEEIQKAQDNKASVIASNQKSAATLGTQSASQQLSLHEHLQSVMEKIVLCHRSNLDFLQPGMERNDLNSTAKSTIAFSQGNSTGFLSGALGVSALFSLQSGISAEVLWRALSLGCAEANRLSHGVDQTKISNRMFSNLSFLSNATRLSAEKVQESSLLETISHTTHQAAEVTFSRSLTVALCHSGLLRQALYELTAAEKDQLERLPHFAESSLISAAIMDKLGDAILKVLNDVQNNERIIPGLNRDMASQLASSSKGRILSGLSTHSVLITPILQSIAATKLASQINPVHKNEALSGSIVSQTVTMGLNMVQAFTQNCIKVSQKDSEDFAEARHRQNNSSLRSHLSSNQIEVGTMIATCGLSLLCDELIEVSISRSLTLLQKEDLKNITKQSSLESRLQGARSSAIIAIDSDLGKRESVTHSISALRLILTRLGQSLADYGKELDKRSKVAHYNYLQDDLNIHTTQQALLASLGSSLSKCSASMLQVAGVLSMLPIVSGGSIDQIRQVMQAFDHELQFRRVHTSANSTQRCTSDESLSIGVSTDFTVEILVNLAKMLLRASLFGLNSFLSITKVLEISTLHQHPEQALSLEVEELSQPNGVTKNVANQMQRSIVGSSVLAAISSMETKTHSNIFRCTDDSIHSIQAAINKEIDSLAMLADEEEDRLVGLMLFCKILIQVLAKHTNRNGHQNNYNDLVARFNRGGIALAGFHSASTGITNPLIHDDLFMGCDDLAALLNTFIFKAAADELGSRNEGEHSLLGKFREELLICNKNLSEKASSTWEYLVKKISQVLNRSRDSYRMPFNKEIFWKTMTAGRLNPLPAAAPLDEEIEGVAVHFHGI
jgi:hypothetical protein